MGETDRKWRSGIYFTGEHSSHAETISLKPAINISQTDTHTYRTMLMAETWFIDLLKCTLQQAVLLPASLFSQRCFTPTACGSFKSFDPLSLSYPFLNIPSSAINRTTRTIPTNNSLTARAGATSSKPVINTVVKQQAPITKLRTSRKTAVIFFYCNRRYNNSCGLYTGHKLDYSYWDFFYLFIIHSRVCIALYFYASLVTSSRFSRNGKFFGTLYFLLSRFTCGHSGSRFGRAPAFTTRS